MGGGGKRQGGVDVRKAERLAAVCRASEQARQAQKRPGCKEGQRRAPCPPDQVMSGWGACSIHPPCVYPPRTIAPPPPLPSLLPAQWP